MLPRRTKAGDKCVSVRIARPLSFRSLLYAAHYQECSLWSYRIPPDPSGFPPNRRAQHLDAAAQSDFVDTKPKSFGDREAMPREALLADVDFDVSTQ